jgi:hypothetical protein
MTYIEGIGTVANEVETYSHIKVKELHAALVERDQTEADAMERFMND